MFNNHLYNLMLQLVEEHKSLWRIKKMYKKDAGRCQECQRFWSNLEKDKLSQIKELQTLIKTHLK